MSKDGLGSFSMGGNIRNCLKTSQRIQSLLPLVALKRVVLEFPSWLSGNGPNQDPWGCGFNPNLLSGLRIQHCCEVWCMQNSNCSSDSTPSLGTSICCWYGPKKKKKKKKKVAQYSLSSQNTYQPFLCPSFLTPSLSPFLPILPHLWHREVPRPGVE